MRVLKNFVRQGFLAALLCTPISAEVSVRFDKATGHVIVAGLAADRRNHAFRDNGLIGLHVAGAAGTRSMLLNLSNDGANVIVEPRFALKAGTIYMLRVGTDGYAVSTPQPKARTPELASFAPSQSVIPANTLRFYLHFSEPMARGQLREAVILQRADGTPVERPFLSLEAELWDASQKRATLLLDPGRLKQGVGPNAKAGTPLVAGQSYRLIISPRMQSAAGAAMGRRMTVAFTAGPPERRAIDVDAWKILRPRAAEQAPLTVTFDRIMDSAAVGRLVKLLGPGGIPIAGRVSSDGGGWSLAPIAPWKPGTYQLVVDPTLEDISGNTPSAAFDAQAGTIGAQDQPVTREFEITG